MKQQSNTLWYMVLVTLALGVACFSFGTPQADTMARVSMLNVGQGDSFLIQAKNGTSMLIDGGPDESVLSELAKLLPSGDRTIDVVIATHPDSDHIGGLPFVLSRYTVGLFLTTQAVSDSVVFKKLMQTIADRHISAYYARRGMNLSFGQGTLFSVLFPDRDTFGWETNTASVVGKLKIGNRTALFTGDLPSSVESILAAAIPQELDVDVVKLGHHGSKTSNSEVFLRATSPTLALISAGIQNRYGHPSKEIIDRLLQLHIPYISTQDSGTYTLRTDGEQWYEK